MQLDGDDNKNKKEVDDSDCEKEGQDLEQVCLPSPHICILTVSRYFRIGHL